MRHPIMLWPLLLVCFSRPLPAQLGIHSDLKFDIRSVDKSVDPCSDFYQYACGGWLAQNKLPPDQSHWAVFQQMRDLNDQRVRSILQQAAVERPNRSSNQQQIGDYYFACMDEKTIAEKGLNALRPELDRIAAMRNPDDLARELAHLHQLGSDALFATESDQRLGDATQVIAYFDQSQLNLPEPGYYTAQEPDSAQARAAYRAHLERVFTLLGRDPQQAALAAADVLRIETALAQASLTEVQRRDRKAWYHERSAVQLTQLAPAFPWATYFAALDFQPAKVLNVAVPRYMQALNKLLQENPVNPWKNYFQWELVRLATPALPEEFRRAEFEFYGAELRGVSQPPGRAHQCDDLTSRDLGEAVGKRYAELYFPPETRQRVLAMVDRLRAAMKEDFQQISWMSSASRQQAIQKLDRLRVLIGYPDHWRDYSSLVITRGDALGNMFRAQQFEFRRQLAKIGKPVERGEFYEPVQGVEGYHDNSLNVVVFTAGILQPPFFDAGMDDAVNFGLAGGVIGHEFTHAFDDKGRQFDGDGNLANWWTPADAKNYEERAACFVRQYSQYTAADGIKVDGQLTLGENVADNGGLQLAYAAFQNDPASNASARDGFTPDQRFFLGWAQWRCMSITEKAARVLARSDQHSPGRWRVNGVVSNMPGFAHAYHCKAPDPMVNKTPCRLW